MRPSCSNSHGGRVCRSQFIDRETALGTWNQAPHPDLWTQNPVPFALSTMTSFCAAFREQCYPPAVTHLPLAGWWVLLKGFPSSLPLHEPGCIYPHRLISLLFINFFTVPHARFRKLGQVEPSSQHTPIRQTLLPPTEFEKSTSVSRNSLPAVPLRRM